MKVIASSAAARATSSIVDGKLYVVLTRREFPSRQGHADHPGRHAPHFRRREDVERYKTTEQVERAYVEDRGLLVSLQGWRRLPLHEQENYEQVHGPGRHRRRLGAVPAGRHAGEDLPSTRASRSPSKCPQQVTLEVIETEPAIKGQTASASFKPAMLSNGVRTMVPPHITVGTRVVIITTDGSYVERAKD